MVIICIQRLIIGNKAAILFYLETGESYNRTDILDAEIYLLRSVSYDLSYSQPCNFMRFYIFLIHPDKRRINKADNHDIRIRALAKYFLEVTLVHEEF